MARRDGRKPPFFMGLGLLLAASAPIAGSEWRSLRFERIGIEHGLSHSSIICMAQDGEGWLWFGTEDGLNRYDGYRFTVYRHDPRKPESLTPGYVQFLFEDREGDLWVGTLGGGLNFFDRERERFVHHRHEPGNPMSLSHDAVNAILETRDGALWVGTEGGLNRRDRDGEGFTRYRHDPGDERTLASDRVTALLQDASGTIWVGTERGLHRFDAATDTFVRLLVEVDGRERLLADDIHFLHEDSEGRLWVATYRGGLVRIGPDRRRAVRYRHDPADSYSIGSNDINMVREDPFDPGTLWLGTRGAGLVRLDLETEQFFPNRHDPSDPRSISNNRVSSFLHDRSGTLWVGTFDEGLNKLHRSHGRFLHFTHIPSNPASLSDDYVRSLAEDGAGNLWVGTFDGGLNRLDSERKRFTRYLHDPSDPRSLSTDEIRDVYVDREGYVWAGTYHGGLNRLDPARGMFEHFLHQGGDSESLSDNRVMAIREDAKGELWVGTESGLNRLDRKRGKFARYFHDPRDPASLNHNRIYDLFLDRSGALWVATFGGGLARFDDGEGRFVRYTNEPGNSESLPSDFVLSFHEDGGGNLWVGTLNGGLAKLDRMRGAFTTYTTDVGLPSNVIHSILEDETGHLWLGTNEGMARFDPQTGATRTYDTGDGLLTKEFSARAYTRTARGELAFGTVAGLTLFYPAALRDNSRVPPIVLTDFQVLNESVQPGVDSILERPIWMTDSIALSYRESVFAFEFAALDYVAPEKNEYAFQMEGFDPDWTYVGTRRSATYTNLDPGGYVFRVKGSNGDGIWNEAGTSVRLTITPPLWRTSWAYCLYALAFLSTLYAARRYEVNRIHLKNQVRLEQLESEKLKSLDRVKSRFFANISHEFRTPLTLILGPVKDLIEDVSNEDWKEKLRLVERNGRRLQRLIHQLLELSRLEAGKMVLQAAPGDVVPFAKGVTMAFSSMAERRGIELLFRANPEAIELYFDRLKLEDVLVNLLSNAFQFTMDGGRIEVRVESDDERATISLRDTGVGISPGAIHRIFDRFYHADSSTTREHEGTGIGLALAKEIVELHRGTIEVESRLGVGTTFFVRLPRGKDHLAPHEITEAAATHSLVPPDEAMSTPGAVEARETRGEAADLLLLVEDNDDLRAYMRKQLESAYEVLEAKNGAVGLERAREKIPDLVVSDVMMPSLNGYELCRALKTDERTSHIPVILLTAKADPSEKLEGLETGADDYLTKPFDGRELLARIRNLILLRRKLRQRFSGAVVLKPKDLGVSSVDEAFLERALAVVEEHLGEEEFSVEKFGGELGLSRSQLHRKLRGLTNQPPTLFIRSIRLQRAAELLKKRSGTVAEVAYAVGFSSQAYFSKCFREEFGCTPKEYASRSHPSPDSARTSLKS